MHTFGNGSPQHWTRQARYEEEAKRVDSYRTQDCSTVELLGTSDASLMHSKEHTNRTRSGSVDSSKNGRTNTPA